MGPQGFITHKAHEDQVILFKYTVLFLMGESLTCVITVLPAAVKSSGVQKSQSGTLEPIGTSTQPTGFASPLLSGLRALAALKQVWLHVHRSNTLTV